MSFSRFITSLVLGAAMVAAAAVSTSGTSIQHNFQAGSGGYNGDYVSEDINGVVDKLGKVSGNAKLLWKDDFIASSSSLKVFDSNLQAFTISRVDDEAYAAANTTTKGSWAYSEIRLKEDGEGRIIIQSPRPVSCRKGNRGEKGDVICSF